MDYSKYRDIEEKYKILKDQQSRGIITADDMKVELKKLMVTDENGYYWMLGGKTGKWYYYDGSKWNEGDPYKDEEKDESATADTIQIEIEPQIRRQMRSEEVADDEEATEKEQEVECIRCRAKIPQGTQICPYCDTRQSQEKEPVRRVEMIPEDREFLIKSINKISFLLFLGGVGLIAGVVFGAFFGIYPIMENILKLFPLMLQEARGGFAGGLIFAAVGGICGFALFALLSLFLAFIYDFIAFIFGGIRIRVKW
jgi:hypothetical protein